MYERLVICWLTVMMSPSWKEVWAMCHHCPQQLIIEYTGLLKLSYYFIFGELSFLPYERLLFLSFKLLRPGGKVKPGVLPHEQSWERQADPCASCCRAQCGLPLPAWFNHFINTFSLAMHICCSRSPAPAPEPCCLTPASISSWHLNRNSTLPVDAAFLMLWALMRWRQLIDDF